MPPVNRPDYNLNLEGLPQLSMSQPRSTNTSRANSPSELPAGSGLRYPLGNSLGSVTPQSGTGRAGNGSPSKEFGSGSRLFPNKRAREIQQQEGLTPQPWGPPPTGSGHSTPLRETIPESPGSDSFPDFDAGDAPGIGSGIMASTPRRTRAGTVPSRFPGLNSLTNSASSFNRSNRGTPVSTPFQTGSLLSAPDSLSSNGSGPSGSTLLSRLRAGSMPQRNTLINPFGGGVFASNWMTGRDRSSTLQSIRSSDGPSSPSRGGSLDNDRTLDYLGLVDTPQSGRGSLSRTEVEALVNQQRVGGGMTIADLATLNAYNNKNTANRFRSYSVNATEKYADGEEDDLDQYELQQIYNGQEQSAQAAGLYKAIQQHNLEVQAFANLASSNRPRARTAGVLDSPTSRALRTFLPTASRLDSSITAADLQNELGADYASLATAVQNMSLSQKASFEAGLDPNNLETPTRALWLGSIPASTTTSTLNRLFGSFGQIESARVLTHKSCGFVNFVDVQSAIAAKAQCNGKELFPGGGPIRIGFAKEQSATNTPGANGTYPSPSPDPFVSRSLTENVANTASPPTGNVHAETAAAALVTPNLLDLRDEIFAIVEKFGATAEDHASITAKLDSAMSFTDYSSDIPPIGETGHNRYHDAPRLREIRKRIDNNSCSPVEIENIATEMLPEIAELSSDYLGNTVVQKLFENCSEQTKEAMLSHISPHLAEIGVHKNGTWAAQKIIDVTQSDSQKHMIIDALRAYGVSLFLDQYGNYVMQCCLRFHAPLNGFIFDTMLHKLWDVAQGRFGARAMRACLESHYATNDQKRLMAAAIALHSVQLATNSNGALLLTWFLDTCTFPHRRSVLAPRIIPHLVHLCTHKVAYLTVLKIINQKVEPEARDSILEALFFNEQTLTDIVSDQTCGATLIFKVLTTPFLEDSISAECHENVRKALLALKAQPSQGYKRLMDEVGLNTRLGGTPVNQDGRASSKTGISNGHLPAADANAGMFGRVPFQPAAPQQYPMDQGISSNLQRTLSMDSNSIDPYLNGYTHSPSMSNTGVNPTNPAQYQQMLQGQGQVSRPPGFHNGPSAPGMHTGMSYNNGSTASHMIDPYRQNLNGNPMMPPGMGMQAAYPQAGYTNPMMVMNGGGVNGYGQFAPMAQYYSPAQMQGGGGQQRRGRR